MLTRYTYTNYYLPIPTVYIQGVIEIDIKLKTRDKLSDNSYKKMYFQNNSHYKKKVFPSQY